MEIAQRLGKKTGVITSDYLTGATPASFLAHVTNRYQAEEILNCAATSGADFIAGQNQMNGLTNLSQPIKRIITK